MFENWIADQTEEAELAKNHAYLLGSFWNPEAVKKMVGNDANTHVSSDEDLEASMKIVKEYKPTAVVEDGKPKRHRKRKITL